eukprot:5816243-Amphidinium_carterae.4
MLRSCMSGRPPHRVERMAAILGSYSLQQGGRRHRPQVGHEVPEPRHFRPGGLTSENAMAYGGKEAVVLVAESGIIGTSASGGSPGALCW